LPSRLDTASSVIEQIKRLGRIGYNGAQTTVANAGLPSATDGTTELAVRQPPLPMGNICF